MLKSVKKNAVSLLFLCCFVAVASLFASAQKVHAVEVENPVLSATPAIAKLQANGCIQSKLNGSGFAANALVKFVVPGGHNGMSIQPISPKQTKANSKGSFIQSVKVCPASPDFSPTDAVTVLASYSGDPMETLASTPIKISSPDPMIEPVAKTVKFDYGCATVKIMGTGFVPSTYIANRAYFFSEPYPVGKAYTQVNVLGGGNIGASFSICGVKLGQVLTIYAWDLASKKFSNAAEFVVVEHPDDEIK